MFYLFRGVSLGESACRRGSVPGPVARFPFGDHLSVRSTRAFRPKPGDGQPIRSFDLAPDGVYQAARVAPSAGALLPHRFTLTCDQLPGPSAVCFLWHFPAGHPDWPLASILSYGAPTFLRPIDRSTRGHPADSPRTSRVTGCRAASGDEPDGGSSRPSTLRRRHTLRPAARPRGRRRAKPSRRRSIGEWRRRFAG